MKMKPKDMESSTYVDIGVENNDKYPKFEVVHHFGISKYKAIISNSYTPYWYEEHFVIEKVKNTVPWTYAIEDLNVE